MDREQMIEVMVEEAVGSYSVGTDRKAMTRAIEDALAALEAAGVVMVPREPTEEMARAGMTLRSIQDNGICKDTVAIYTAMLAARPK